MSSYWLRGSINSGSSFFITAISQNVFYLLNLTSDGTTLYFQPISSSDDLIKARTFPIFIGSGNAQGFTLSGTTSVGYSSNNVMIPTTPAMTLVATQTSYATWNPPSLFLAGVQYNIMTPSSLPILYNYSTGVDDNDQPILSTTTTELFTVLFVPTTVWSVCNVGGQDIYTDTPTTVLDTAWCAYAGTQSTQNSQFCEILGVYTSGWTQQEECEDGIQYTYCSTDETCGTNCKGPCAGNLTCSYNASISGFECPSSSSTSWWSSPWFLGVLIIISILIIIAFIILILAFRH